MERRVGWVLVIVWGTVLSGCVRTTPRQVHPDSTAHADVGDNGKERSNMAAEAKQFLNDYLARFETLETRSTRLYWAASNSGRATDFDAYAEAALAVRQLHSDSEDYRQIARFLANREALDPVTARSLEVAYLSFKGNQLPAELLKTMVAASTEIERIFNTFRAEVNGEPLTNNDMLEALKSERDSGKRQALWEGLKQVGRAVGPKLKALAVLRNEGARQLGFSNYWEMQIILQEHDPAVLLKIFEALEVLTTAPYKEMKRMLDAELAARFNVSQGAIMPWHYDNPFFQEAPPSAAVDLDDFYKDMQKEQIMALAAEFYAGLGLPIDTVIAHSDLYEREGKDQHAFCITLDRKKDVRTLLNIKPTASWMETALHEEGHAIYYLYIDESLPFNLREANHIFTTEAIAMLFGALAKNPSWMVAHAGADEARVKALEGAIAAQRRREQLIFARWSMVMLYFEKSLYENPDQDLNRLWWDYVERFQLVPRPEGRHAPDWAAKPHFTIAPVYYHNYLLGEVFASQLRHVLAAIAGHGPAASLAWSGRKDLGAFLIEKVFKPGMRLPWPQFVEAATSEPLTVRYYGEELR